MLLVFVFVVVFYICFNFQIIENISSRRELLIEPKSNINVVVDDTRNLLYR